MLIEQRTSLRGVITVPGDKSISHRAILFGSLAKGTTEIDGCLMGEDCLSTIDCFRKMQISIEILSNSKVRVHGKGLYGLNAPTVALNAGRSGTTLRLLLGALVSQPFHSTILRDESGMKKPVGKIIEPLRQMGAVINGRDNGNLCPLSISPAKLNGISYSPDIHDAHIKSPLLIAGLFAEGEMLVTEKIRSRDHSELMLNYLGANLTVDELTVTSRRVENLYAQPIQIPGDLSIAAYFITAGLIVPKADITLKNVGINPTRTGLLDTLRSMGAQIAISNEQTVNNEKMADITIKTSELNAATVGVELIPRMLDEIHLLIVAAAFAKGTTVINGLKGFKIKESNRIKQLAAELSKMGAKLSETEDGIVIEGGKPLRGTIVESNGDSAIAMALSVAGLAANGETMIRKAQAVDIVHPDFFPILNRL